MSQNPFLYYFRLVQGDSIVRRAQWKERGERSKSTEFLHLRASRKGILPRLRRLRLDAQRLSSSEKGRSEFDITDFDITESDITNLI